MKLRVTLSGMAILICSSAIIRASGKPISSGRLTRRITENISPMLFRFGDDVTGETSTIMAFSTRCGYKYTNKWKFISRKRICYSFELTYLSANTIIARPPMLWPMTIAFGILCSLQNKFTSSARSMYRWYDECGLSPWFLASKAITCKIFLN